MDNQECSSYVNPLLQPPLSVHLISVYLGVSGPHPVTHPSSRVGLVRGWALHCFGTYYIIKQQSYKQVQIMSHLPYLHGSVQIYM